jgi:hypothetical protein
MSFRSQWRRRAKKIAYRCGGSTGIDCRIRIPELLIVVLTLLYLTCFPFFPAFEIERKAPITDFQLKRFDYTGTVSKFRYRVDPSGLFKL